MNEALIQFFEWSHLPPELQIVSCPFKDLAVTTILVLPASEERTMALRKLLEAKDCAVRAALFERKT